jgi:Baseplate J-like protein
VSSSTYNYIGSTGTIIPDTSDILSEVQTTYQDVFGTDIVLDPSSPQGVLITAEALAEAAVANNNAQLANQINPNIAGGVFLDAIMALTGIQRTAQTQTLVTNVTVAGVAGTIIPAGSQAQTAAGDIFVSAAQVTLPGGGSTQVNFYSQAFGPIPCASNALNQVVSSVLGWETVTNNPASSPASATTLGVATQSDQAARALRQNTLAFQGVSLAAAITSALYNVSGVTSLTFQENVSATTQTINGISMVSHSIYACVAGGTDTDVAAALLENKSSGCAWNGSTSVSVIEPASGQTYTVLFDRPTQVGILVKITTPNGNATNVIQAVLDYANGLVQSVDQNGVSSLLPGFVVGASVSPFEIAAAIAIENPGIYISQVQISVLSPISYSTSAIAIGVNEIAQTQASYISVVTS